TKNLILDSEILNQKYCVPIQSRVHEIPVAAIYPNTTSQIVKIIQYLRTLKDINVLLISSTTDPKFLDDTITTRNTIIIDLSKMTNIPFINKRNKVCVVEPGVAWGDLVESLKKVGLRPRVPFLPRKGKSVLASVLDREPHLVPKAMFDISDPLLCMEVVFGNGEVFRTGEAAGPRSLEENRQAGAALKNPLGPGQTDIFRLIQGSKGTYGCVTWISMQCDFIPTKRVVHFINLDSIQPLTEFVYMTVRRRLVDEIFIINNNLFKAIFPSASEPIGRYILIYAINGYEWLPEEKVAYQSEDCAEILSELGLEMTHTLSGIQQVHIEPILDGRIVDPHPKFSDKTIAMDLFYTTTLDRAPFHVDAMDQILQKHQFPLDRLNIYVQPVIQARATHLEFSLIADKPSAQDDSPTSYNSAGAIVKAMAEYAVTNGGFFSRPYKLVKEFSFQGHEMYAAGLRKIKKIFDPNSILNKGELCF
ncbi:MAG TPA: FAD-binding protein, partial [Candidatus Deferrimicrobium sp.]|nr:FAD-binding protein [Candidatus Deferrimicrobium sp.]